MRSFRKLRMKSSRQFPGRVEDRRPTNDPLLQYLRRARQALGRRLSAECYETIYVPLSPT